MSLKQWMLDMYSGKAEGRQGPLVNHKKGGCDGTGSDVPNDVLCHTDFFSKAFCLLAWESEPFWQCNVAQCFLR